MKPDLWRPPEESLMNLRDIGRQINHLTATRTQAKNRLHALGSKSGSLPWLIKDEREAIAGLGQRIERLPQAAREILDRLPEYRQPLEPLCQAQGIGETSAIALLAEPCVLPRILKSSPGQPVRRPGCASLPVRLPRTPQQDRQRLSAHRSLHARPLRRPLRPENPSLLPNPTATWQEKNTGPPRHHAQAPHQHLGLYQIQFPFQLQLALQQLPA